MTYTSGNKPAMTEAAKQAKRAYHREWERKNKAKRAAYRAAYWERKALEQQRGGVMDG